MIELTARCQALFHFVDFNQTLGLVFTGDATTTDCGRKAVETIGNGSSAPTAIINSSSTVLDLMESGGVQTRRTVETSVDGDDSSSIASREAIFGHRDEFAGEKKAGCPTRLRLTKSAPSQTGSVWYEKRVPVVSFILPCCVVRPFLVCHALKSELMYIDLLLAWASLPLLSLAYRLRHHLLIPSYRSLENLLGPCRSLPWASPA